MSAPDLVKKMEQNFLFFCGLDWLFYGSDSLTIGDYIVQQTQLYIPRFDIEDISQILHNHYHSRFTKCYELICSSYYISKST